MNFRTFLTRLGALTLLLAAGTGTAHAVGTTAGTAIDNSASLSYSVGGTAQTPICSSPSGNSTPTCTKTTFKVDKKINLSITTDAAPGVASVPGSTTTLTFVVSNLGNSDQRYGLSTAQSASGTSASPASVGHMFGGGSGTTASDTFDATGCQIYDAASPSSTTASVLITENGSATIKVACSIPLGLINSDLAAVTLKAAAEASPGTLLTESTSNDQTVVDVAFADGSGTPEDGVRDGAYSARSAYKINTAAVQVTKAFITLCDPAGGAATSTPPYTPKSIPGAYVQYTVTITNAATPNVTALLTALTDALDVGKVNFDTELITGANVSAGPPVVNGCLPTTATPVAGTAESAGKAFKVVWSGTSARTSFGGGTSGTRYLSAPAATFSTPNVTVDWTTVLPIEGAYTNKGELRPGESVTVTFNVIIK